MDRGNFSFSTPARLGYHRHVLTVHTLDQLSTLEPPLHLALGFFDGVHIGHQAVIRRAVDAARQDGGMAGVVTFHPHPCYLTNPANVPAPLVANLDHKARIIDSLGVNVFVPLRFDLAMSKTPAEAFIACLSAARVRTIAVGEDWRFGCGRLGDVEMLRAHASKGRFRVEAVLMVMIDGERVSSTRIRQAIRDGALPQAARMLGRPYSIRGKVIHGRKLASQMGFPTANLAPGQALTPPDGVWAVRVTTDTDESLAGIANLGIRPTIDGTTRILEVHLFDFNANLYDQDLEVRFEHFLRPEIRFGSIDELRQQIAADAVVGRQFFAR